MQKTRVEILLSALLLVVLTASNSCVVRAQQYEAFGQEDEAAYLSSFDTLIRDSYSARLPAGLVAQCKNGPQAPENLMMYSISNSMTSAELQSVCGTDTICHIAGGFTVTMNSNLNVAALMVSGRLVWNDATQQQNEQWICAGYVAVNGGRFEMNLVEKTGYIYVKNNGAKHATIFSRSVGAFNSGQLNIVGRHMTRTWSLVAEEAFYGAGSITLAHSPVDMGWRVGDRIVIAPTVQGSSGDAEDFTIAGFGPNNTLRLAGRDGLGDGVIKQVFRADQKYTGTGMNALMQAEVINLSRNIIITGDDFQHVACRQDVAGNGMPPDNLHADHCSCWGGIGRTRCTLGLHMLAVGQGAVLNIQYTRIEKCGQRGILGKYCTHFHLMRECPDCKLVGNAIEYGHNRGTVIHGTHLALVEDNVYNDVRGATIYIEDGNEMYNRVLYNVAVCPWAKSGEKRGCTIPGTNNGQADTTLNQAGIWGLSFTNYVIGNRFANNYNGMLYQEQGFGGVGGGRGHVNGLECVDFQQVGRLEGNTFHGCGRFGTYVLAAVFPKRTDRSVARNGLPTLSTCQVWTPEGEDNGLPATFWHNVDYNNVFVGQYGAGDLQYRFHTSLDNNNLIYWKETKNFQDGCSSHLADSFYENGNMALPGGHGTFIIENVVFNNRVNFECSHHCDVGITGVLCMPTYVFVNMKWTGTINDGSIVDWGPNNGAMFTLGPDDQNNALGNYLFPAGFVSVVHPYWTYLLALDGGNTCFNTAQAAAILNMDAAVLTRRYNNRGAIFCRKPVRRLEIFSFDQRKAAYQNMRLELWQNNQLVSTQTLNYLQIGDDPSRKQGYSATVVPGLGHQYRLSMSDGGAVPADWIIEFSDPVFGNRWQRDEINLVVAGRACPSPVHSQHDRRYIWSGEDYLRVRGRGACTAHPDMAPVNCRTQPALDIVESCPGRCGACNNGFCDCSSARCMCNPGYSGANCEIDLCAAAECRNGNCAARYLGGSLPVTSARCVCREGWYGEHCDTNVKPPEKPAPEPVCLDGSYFYKNSDIAGGNLASAGASNPRACSELCSYNAACNSWVWAGGACYMKTGTTLLPHATATSGIKCSAGPVVQPTTNNPATQSTGAVVTTGGGTAGSCDGRCQGTASNYYGCNPSFQFAYCNSGGGCSYAYQPPDSSVWCCIKNC